MDLRFWDGQMDEDSFSSTSDESDIAYFDEPDYIEQFAAFYRGGSRRPLRARGFGGKFQGQAGVCPPLPPGRRPGWTRI